MRRLPFIGAISLTLALAACGGSSSPKVNEAALKRGLLTSGQLAGMVAQPPSLTRSAKAEATTASPPGTDPKTEIARLRRIGFIASISEQLSSPGNPAKGGLSFAEQLSSPKGSAAEVAHTTVTGGPWHIFAVPGIPGARGFDQTSGGNGGRNIAFAHGDYMYLIGSGWSGGAADGVPRATMITVAQRLYHRIAG